MTTRLSDIRSRLQGITKGPWLHRLNGSTASVYSADPTPIAICLLQQVHLPRVPINADFIAHAPEDITYLLSERDRMVELLTTIRKNATCAAHPICQEYWSNQKSVLSAIDTLLGGYKHGDR